MTANYLTFELSYDTPDVASSVTVTNVASTFPSAFTASGSVMLVVDLSQQGSKDATYRQLQRLQKAVDECLLFLK